MTGLELRLANVAERIVEGIVVPYNETSFMTPDPRGERFMPGSLTRTIRERGERIKLFRSHEHKVAVGKAVSWNPTNGGGCWAQFRIANTPAGDAVLTEVREGMLDAFSVGFLPKRETRGADGARQIIDADLHEVSLCPIGAYDGARVVTTRSPSTVGGLEWTTFDRRPPGPAQKLSVGGRDDYRRAQRQYELDRERRAHPDSALYGVAAPYNIPLDDGRGNRIEFSRRTVWVNQAGQTLLNGRSLVVPLQLEHGGSHVGTATIIEETNGLVVDGTIYHQLRGRVKDRRHLSIGLGPFTCRERSSDGVLEVNVAELREVSMVHNARWADHCGAAVWQRAS